VTERLTGPLLQVSRLNVWFDVPGGEAHAVRDVSFELASGSRLGLVGESGCGKTTALLALMGLLPPNATVAGQVLLDGADLLVDGEQSVAPHRWRNVAMVFQGAMNAFSPVHRVGDQIVEPMEFHGTCSGRAAKDRAKDLLELVGIPVGRFSAFPHELSGGQRQRAAIAMALACEPKLLLADEPTTALDVIVQAQVLDLLVRLSEQLGLAVVLVTHDLPLVTGICHRTAVMYAGQVAELGPSGALVDDPQHPYTRMLFAATPDIEVTHEIESIPGTPPRLDRPITGCAFAPRCDVVEPRCTERSPELQRLGSDRTARCLRPGARR
jgi:peptide/nickel transport system ATP-binding protein